MEKDLLESGEAKTPDSVSLFGKIGYLASRVQIVLRIAFGNLWEHKSKTLILGILVTIGVMLIVCGNAFLEASRRGIERDFKANYTGDVLIHGISEDGDVSLFGVNQMVMTGDMPETPALIDTSSIVSLARSVEGVLDAVTSITAIGLLYKDDMPEDWESPDGAEPPHFYLIAGETDSYWKMLPAVNIIEGSYPAADKGEILIGTKMKEKYEKYYETKIAVGDKIIVQQFTGFSMREVTICGFFEPYNPESTMMSICYSDLNTARSIAKLTYGASLARTIPEEVDTTLAKLDETDLFGASDDMFESSDLSSEAFTSDSVLDILGDTSMRDKLNETDDGAWHFVQLRLENPKDEKKVIAELNRLFTEKGLPLKADNWKDAAGPFASISDMMNTLFTILVSVLAVVVFIVIMNTLIVSVIERTGEIGTMRAIGASRGFVRGLFFSESVLITVIASVAGSLLALIAIVIVNSLHITIEGETARVMLGGGLISMIPTFSSILSTIGIVVFGSVAANIYPVAIALRITPLKAMNQGQ